MILVEEQMQTDLDSQFWQDLARQRMPELCGQRDGRRPFAGIGMDWHGFRYVLAWFKSQGYIHFALQVTRTAWTLRLCILFAMFTTVL